MDIEQETKPNLPMDKYELWGELVKVHKLISKEREIELARYGITAEQSHILHHLNNQGGSSTLNEIANSSFVNHNAASMIVRRMEKLGFVTRSKQQNSKQFCVAITQKGEETFRNMPINSIEMTFSSLSAEEASWLLICLNILEGRARELLGMNYKPLFL
jgi:DNA-binding MarR family transcriptional regulator